MEFRMLAQRLQLGAKKQRPARSECVVKRLFAGAITRDEQVPTTFIPDGKGEHPSQAFDARRAVLLISVQDRLGVRVRFELMPSRCKVALQLAVVIDFAIEDN